jgi:hypothetical protein
MTVFTVLFAHKYPFPFHAIAEIKTLQTINSKQFKHKITSANQVERVRL